MNMSKLLKYADALLPEAKKRYKEKIGLIGNVDPFAISENTQSVANHAVNVSTAALSPVDSSDLVSYLVLQTSFVTVKQFKAHNSMEAYNQFACGWVKDVKAWKVSGKSIVTGKVIILVITLGATKSNTVFKSLKLGRPV